MATTSEEIVGEPGDAVPSTASGLNALFDSMQKILSKSISKSAAPILAKEKSIERQIEDEKLLMRARRLEAIEKKEKQDRNHVLPDITKDIDLEKRLRRTATKGVVKLFNAIEHGHKATFNSGVKRPGFSLEKDLAIKKTKKAFVDYLVASAGTQQVEGKPAIASSVNAKKPVESQKNIPTTAQSTGKWNVIKDDFMLNESSLKNWDVDE